MTLSVVIPVYNVENFLMECLESVFSQEVADIEVICVNDGSTDSSGAILAEYQTLHDNMKIISQANAGLSCARNSGLKTATGDYIYFLDSDDYLLPGAIRMMLDFAIANKVDIAGFNVATDDKPYYFKNGFDIAKCSGENYLKAYLYHTGRYFNAPVWMYLYKSDFIRKNDLEFSPGRLHEDNEFSGRALYLAESCAMHNEAIQMHRVNRKGSIMADVSAKHYIHRLMNFRDLFSFYMKRPLKSPFIEALICQFLSIISESRKSRISLSQIGFRPSDFLKFLLISPFYAAVLYRRWWRKSKRSF